MVTIYSGEIFHGNHFDIAMAQYIKTNLKNNKTWAFLYRKIFIDIFRIQSKI